MLESQRITCDGDEMSEAATLCVCLPVCVRVFSCGHHAIVLARSASAGGSIACGNMTHAFASHCCHIHTDTCTHARTNTKLTKLSTAPTPLYHRRVHSSFRAVTRIPRLSLTSPVRGQ
jgi:hypothetical protein